MPVAPIRSFSTPNIRFFAFRPTLKPVESQLEPKASVQALETIRRRGEVWITVAYQLGMGVLEGRFRRNPIDPALMRQLFVIGKIQADDHHDISACAVFFLFRDCMLSFGSLFGRLVPVELQQQLLIQPEALLPAFNGVARLLSRLFVCTEIKYQKGLGHTF